MWRLLKRFYYRTKISDRWNWWWYDIKYGVKNIFAYLPIIWRDRSWDYIWLMELIDKKLEGLEEQKSKYSYELGAEKKVEEIHRTRLAIKRILEDKYYDNVYQHHDEKWGEVEIDSQPSEWDEKGKPTMYRMYINRPNALTPEQIGQEAKEYRGLMKKPDTLQKQDYDYVFNMLRKHIRGWWD